MSHESRTLKAFYERYVFEGQASWHEDRVDRIVELLRSESGTVLDVGCGTGRNLARIRAACPDAVLYGTDISEYAVEAVRAAGFLGDVTDPSGRLPFGDRSFSTVVCGEVIEHVVDPDALLSEIRRVLVPNGRLILTTPNLAYAVNRVLLLLGVQPLFTETSLHRNYGRYFLALGQGRSTQGHLKIFTARAMRELLYDAGFCVNAATGYRFIQCGPLAFIDELLRRVPGLAAGYIFDATTR